MCHLREFFIVHHMREKEDKRADVVTIPKIHSQQIVLDLSGQAQTYEQLVCVIIKKILFTGLKFVIVRYST